MKKKLVSVPARSQKKPRSGYFYFFSFKSHARHSPVTNCKDFLNIYINNSYEKTYANQCFHKSSMKFPFLSVKFPFSPLNFVAQIMKFPFKFPSYSETSWRLWRINNLYSGASRLMRLCLKRKDVEHTGS